LQIWADLGTECISIIRMLKSFGGETLEISRYASLIDASCTIGTTKARVQGFFIGSNMFLTNTAVLLLLYEGSLQVVRSQIDIALLTSFILYAGYLVMGLAEISALLPELENATSAS
jgi:ATP-binding cassette subfamily B protein